MFGRQRRASVSIDKAREICREIAVSKGVAFFGLRKHHEPQDWTVIFALDHTVTRHFTASGDDETAFRRSVLAAVFDDH